MASVFDQLNWEVDNDPVRLINLVSQQADTQTKLRAQLKEQLLRDYPQDSLGWLSVITWSAPRAVPLSSFNLREAIELSQEQFNDYAQLISEGTEPIVAIRLPGLRHLTTVDGRMRLGVCRQLRCPVPSWVGKAHTANGPWEGFHRRQRRYEFSTGEISVDVAGEVDERLYRELLEFRRETREQHPVGHPRRVAAERAVRQARRQRSFANTTVADPPQADPVSQEVDETQQEAEQMLAGIELDVSETNGTPHSKLLTDRKQAQAKYPPGHPERVKAERAVRQSRAAARSKATNASSSRK